MKHQLLLKFAFLGLLAFLSQQVQSQNYNMPVTGSSSITVCSGTVYDNGGTGNYSNNSNSTITINPGIAGNKISITFTSFSNAAGAAGGDWIDIYDGTSTSAPYLLQHLSANSAGFFFTQDETYTATNSSGAITIRFTTDGTGTDIGFSATISCLPRRPDLIIQTPSVTPNSFLPAGAGISVSSTIYNQGDAIASSSDIGYYLSANTTFDASDVYLGNSTGTSLAISSGSPREASLTIPSETSAGNYYILFVADNSNLETESIESNNVGYSAISVGAPFVDLTITSPSSSIPNISIGSSFTVSAKIYNQGTTSSTSSNIGYYLSSTTVLDGSEVFLNSSSGSSLAGNTSIFRSSTLTIPTITTPGNYYILVVADYGGIVSEADETNNLNYVPITVYPTFTGIIVPSSGSNSVTVCSGEVYDNGGINDYLDQTNGILTINPETAGSNISLSFTSLNIESSYDFLYIYDGTSTSATLIGTYNGSTLPGIIKATNASGALTLKFTSSYSSNSSGFNATISCFVPTRDLVITSPTTLPASIVAGDDVSVSSSITNQGTLSAASSNVGYYLSTNTTYDASDVYLGVSAGAALASSASSSRTTYLTIPSGTLAGDYYILFVADYTNLVTESIESNNINYSPVTILSPYVDLTNTSPSSSFSTIPASTDVTVSFTISNQGTIGATSNIGYYLSTNTIYDASDSYLGNSPGIYMAPSVSINRSVSLTIPSGTTDGNYYILIVADYTNLVTESIETNNLNYVPITVSGIVVPVSGSNSVSLCSGTIYDHAGNNYYSNNANGVLTINPETTGNYISLSFSSFSIETNDYLYVYDGTSTSATLIGKYSGSINPETIYATNPSGALTLQFTADNSGTTPGFIANIACFIPTNEPDLKITTPTASPSYYIPAGSTITVTSSIYNQGIVSATSSNIGYYLSKNTILDGSEVFLDYSAGGALSPGISSTKNLLLTIPTTTTPGNYYILFVADYSGLVSEGNETNNVKYLPITINPQFSGIVVPYSGSNKVTVCSETVYDHALNYGYAYNADGILTIYPETAGSNISLTFSSFQTKSGDDRLYIYDGTSTSATLIGSYSGTTSPGTINAKNASGALTLRFTSLYIANYGGYSGFSATVSCFTPNVDLTITSPTILPTSVIAGTNVSVSSTIQNLGTTSSPSSKVGYYLSTNTTLDASDVYIGNSDVTSLSASASSTITSSLTIPTGTTAGTYYVLYVADYNSNVTESNETNNVTYTSLTVTAASIDLVIQSPSTSATNVVAGSKVTVSLTIYNQGTTPTPSWSVGYYLSTNTTYDASDVYLGFTSGGVLSGNTGLSRTLSPTIPSGTTAGAYYLLYFADYTNLIAETNETNNVNYTNLTVTDPLSDLIIQTPSTSPTTVAAGSTMSVNSTIYNQGTASASSSYVGYYLSTNTTYDVSDVFLGNSSGISLAASTGSAKTASLIIPSGTPAGSYYVLYFADYSELVTESNETNNLNYTNLTVTATTSDLIIQTPVTSPTSISAGSTISVNSNIYNQGVTSASSSYVGYYLSTNTTYDGSDVYLGNSTGASLAASTGSSRAASLTIPSGTTAGTYYVLYVADYTNNVTESNETNNVNYTSLTVTTSTTATCDLRVLYSTTSPTSITAGSSVSVSSYIYNNGPGSAPSSNVGYYLSTNTTYDASDVFLGFSSGGVLPAYGGSTINSTVIIPAETIAGTYYLLYVADYSNLVNETNENNNVDYSFSSISITSPATDLIINSPGLAQSSVYAGETVSLTSSIYNQGSTSAASSNVGYYLSANTTYDASDVYLGYSSGSALSASTSSNMNFTATIPSGTAAGTYYLLFVADYNNSVAESNETNNVNYTTLEVKATIPDLVITSPTASPASVIAGSTISVSSSVHNQGTATASSSNVSYYLSANTTYDASDVYLGYSSGSLLSATASLPISSTVTIPSGTAAGTYYVLFVADYSELVTEGIETNNVNFTSIIVTQLPDLIPTQVTLPSSTYGIGTTISLTHYVNNAGLANAGSSRVAYYLSVDNGISAEDILLGSYNLAGITSGESSLVDISLALNSSINAGNYYLITLVDAYGTITESNELNNTDIQSLTISIPSAIEDNLISSFRLYPNPTEGKFALEYSAGGTNDVVITIYNSLGLLVDSKSFAISNGTNKKEFDLSNQTSGVYTLKVESKGRPSQFMKIVIQ